ncbi:uncharacterized protein FIBRA_09251 [Fibroporia radiculosa]|uniref:Uncharacterized protein n=1 Tax=Fibroporia radiculosa TaxID=599839 RepID=J7RH87_9APHY|nr:uncharacterized protein FIBRA_09251 [Fibroporia radiculosa]CCM06937.1 predicted protein [Fibroporia radiculosa]
MPAERNNHARTNNADPTTPRRPLAPAGDSNTPTTEIQRASTPYPSHLQVLEGRFNAGIIEAPTPIRPTSSLPYHSDSGDSSMEFLNEGGFCYPFTPIPNVTHRPFLIPGSSNSSHVDNVVLHQFPGPLEISHNTSDTTPGSYHIAPLQITPSQLLVGNSSSPNPDSPIAASTDSPGMPPLASDISTSGSLNYPPSPNLHLLAEVSEYVTASKGHSDNPQEFLLWRSIPFDTSTPVQDINPLERIMPYFPGAYAQSLSRPPMGVPIPLNPAFGLRRISVTTADALRIAEPVGDLTNMDWEEDTWEYLLTREDSLLESLWASLQDIRDPGVTDEIDHF